MESPVPDDTLLPLDVLDSRLRGNDGWGSAISGRADGVRVHRCFADEELLDTGLFGRDRLSYCAGNCPCCELQSPCG